MITFEVLGEPVAKGRPRVCKFGTFTPKKTKDYEELVKNTYIKEHGKTKLEGQLKVTINAYFTIPKSASKKLSLDMFSGIVRPTKRPDADNVAKSITDGLNGIAYNDDSSIVELTVKKFYSYNPFVDVTIEEVVQ